MKISDKYCIANTIQGYEVDESELKSDVVQELTHKNKIEIKSKGFYGDVMGILAKNAGKIVLQRYKKFPLKKIKEIICN